MLHVGQRVMLAGSPGEGEVLAIHGEGSVSVGWDGFGLRIHHESQLRDACVERDTQRRTVVRARLALQAQVG